MSMGRVFGYRVNDFKQGEFLCFRLLQLVNVGGSAYKTHNLSIAIRYGNGAVQVPVIFAVVYMKERGFECPPSAGAYAIPEEFPDAHFVIRVETRQEGWETASVLVPTMRVSRTV